MVSSEAGQAILVHSTTLLDAAGPVTDGWLSARDGLIEDRGSGDGWLRHRADHTVVDGSGQLLLPGLTDFMEYHLTTVSDMIIFIKQG